MAALTDAPSVYVDGTQQSPGWSLTERAVLAGVKVTWGRESHLDKANPSTAYVELLDTDGHLQGYKSLVGKTLTIYRSTSEQHDWALRLFNGRIDKFDVEIRWISDPELHYERRVWVLKITASDRLADLARSVLPGPGGAETDILPTVFGENFWGGYTVADGWRFAADQVRAIMNAGADHVVDAIDWRSPPDVPANTVVAPIEWAEGLSALDLIEGLYAAHSLGFANYEPHTNTILLGQPARSDGLALVYSNDVLRLDVPDGFTIPASRVVAIDGYEASTGVDEAIDVVQVNSRTFTLRSQGDEIVGETGRKVTERFVPGADFTAGGRRELAVDVDLLGGIIESSGEDPDPDPTPPSGTYAWPFPLSSVTSEYGWREWSSSFHAGIDFSYGGIGGAAIHPVGPGTVSQVVNWHAGWGNYVVIDHGAGLSSLYAHMVAPSTIGVGTAVTTASTIGNVGNTGNSFGDHLHLETWVNGQHMNPRDWMAARGVGTPANTTNAGGDPNEDFSWPNDVAERYAADLGQLTGLANLPHVRLDWRNFQYAYEVAYHFIRACVRPYAIYFPGSVFNTMLDAAALHQIIGGELVYHDGWTLDAWLAPALGNGEGLTIDELVTNDVAEIRDYQDDITIADLGNVTIGAS